MLAIDRMHFLNRWITPEGRPRRFDTRFFIAEAPAKQHGRHDEYETVDSLWISPAEALTRNDRGEFGLMSVTRRQLETLADFATMRALHDLMTDGARVSRRIGRCCRLPNWTAKGEPMNRFAADAALRVVGVQFEQVLGEA